MSDIKFTHIDCRYKVSRIFAAFFGRFTDVVLPPVLHLHTVIGLAVIYTEKFYAPWANVCDAVQWDIISAVSHSKGIIWDSITVETKGGALIGIRGLRKRHANEAVKLIHEWLQDGKTGSTKSDK